MAAGVNDFIASKRHESYLAQAECPIAESVKRDLLVAPGTDSFLFDQPLLEKVVTHMKEALLCHSVSFKTLRPAFLEIFCCVPVRSLCEYLKRTSGFVNRPRCLFVSPRCPSRAMSKNGISLLLRKVIVHSGASSEAVAAPRAHSIRGIATSSAFFKIWSLSSVLEAASWKSNTVFT